MKFLFIVFYLILVFSFYCVIFAISINSDYALNELYRPTIIDGNFRSIDPTSKLSSSSTLDESKAIQGRILFKNITKKIFLKILLFFIPAAGYLFKLCSVYEEPKMKYHKHHHIITHSKPPPLAEFNPFYKPVIHRPLYHHHYHKQPHFVAVSQAPYFYTHFRDPDKIKDIFVNDEPVHSEPFNEFDSSGVELGDGLEYHNIGTLEDRRRKSQIPKLTSISQIEKLAEKAEHDVLIKSRNKYLSDQQRLKRLPPNNAKNYLEQKIRDKIRYRENLEKKLVNFAENTEKELSIATTVATKFTSEEAIDEPFYSPIVNKINTIFTNIGFKDEPCRKRLICSMYKNPDNFTPYSNYLSNELSRELDELKVPTNYEHVDVLRYFEYLQAARDGQDRKDCLKLYDYCNVKTE